MTNEELTAIIRTVAARVESADSNTVALTVQPLRDAGITADCHVGRGAEMEEDTPAAFRLCLEWYAGQLLALVDTQAWHCINSWLNCLERFAPPCAF